MRNKALFLFTLLTVQACQKDKVEPSGRIDLSKTSGNIVTIAGLGPSGFDYTGDGGLATSAKLGWITSIAVDQSGNVFITDGASNVIRSISASNGIINTIAGTFLGFNVTDPTPSAGDGGAATSAHLHVPFRICVDVSGNVDIIDAGNNVVRQITSMDGKISTIVGTKGQQGYTGDGGPAAAATLWNPYGLAVDGSGNIYLAENGNNAIRKIEKATGKITTIVGLGPDHGSYTGDNGPAISATLNGPTGVAVDANGNIYISDSGNNVIRKITNGTITTIAGTGAHGYTGDGGDATAATFMGMGGIAVDTDGNVYVTDNANSVIRKITTSTGKISTFAGTGTTGYSGDGGPATSAKLSGPWDVAVDAQGNVYIADTGNSAIRVVTK